MSAGVRAPGRPPPALALLALPVVIGLAVGVEAGLARMGVHTPAGTRLLAVNHGALMVSGVVGTVIGLERAVALARPAGYLGPVLSALGAVALLAEAPDRATAALFVASAAGVVGLFLVFLRRQTALPLAVMTVGAACWLLGNVAWLIEGWAPRTVAPWWIAFLALTIAGERLELIRFRPLGTGARAGMAAAGAALILGPALVLTGAETAGFRVAGAGVLVLGGWLVLHDTARRTLRRGGLATYAGVALVAAYAWLGATGLTLAAWGLEPGWRYDTVLHTFFLGFVIGAIFAHAPIILPAITGLTLRFSPVFWLGLATLHGSLVARVGGNLAKDVDWRQAGGVGNAIAVLLLVIAIGTGLVRGALTARAGAARREGVEARRGPA